MDWILQKIMLNNVSNSHKLVTWWRVAMSFKILFEHGVFRTDVNVNKKSNWKVMFIWITFVLTNEITSGFKENIFKRYMTEKYIYQKITFIEKYNSLPSKYITPCVVVGEVVDCIRWHNLCKPWLLPPVCWVWLIVHIWLCVFMCVIDFCIWFFAFVSVRAYMCFN